MNLKEEEKTQIKEAEYIMANNCLYNVKEYQDERYISESSIYLKFLQFLSDYQSLFYLSTSALLRQVTYRRLFLSKQFFPTSTDRRTPFQKDESLNAETMIINYLEDINFFLEIKLTLSWPPSAVVNPKVCSCKNKKVYLLLLIRSE